MWFTKYVCLNFEVLRIFMNNNIITIQKTGQRQFLEVSREFIIRDFI